MEKPMKYFKFLFAVCLASTIAFPLLAKTKKEEEPKPEFNQQALELLLKEINKKIVKQKSKDPLLPTVYLSYASRVKALTNHPDLEKELRIKKKWFTKITTALKAMSKTKSSIKIAVMNKNRKAYNQGEDEYKKQIKQLEHILKNPDRIKKKKKQGFK